MKDKVLLAGPAVMAAGFLLRLLAMTAYISTLPTLAVLLMAVGLVLTVRRHMAADGKIGQLFLGGMTAFGIGLLLMAVESWLYLGSLSWLAYLLAAAGFVLMLLGFSRPDHRIDLKPFFDFKHYKNKKLVRRSLLYLVPGILLLLWGFGEALAILQLGGLGFLAFGIYRLVQSQRQPDVQDIPDTVVAQEEDVALSQEIRNRQLFIGFLRIGSKLLNGIAIVMFLFSVFSESYWLILVAVLLFGIGGLFLPHYEKELKKYVSENIVRKALEEVFQVEAYDPFGAIAYEQVRNIRMGIGSFHDTDGSDYLKGTYTGLPIELCDMTLLYRSVTQDEEGRDVETVSEVFRGLWLICDFGKTLSADLGLWERGKLGKVLGGKGIQTENQEFNRQFQVESQIPAEAFYILTPHMMEYILEMDRKAQGQTHMCFLRSGQVHIAIQRKQDSFEAGKLAENATQLRKKFLQEIRYITGLIDELRLVDTLYK